MEINDEIIRLLLLVSIYVGGYRFFAWCYSKVDYRTRCTDRFPKSEPGFREARLDP